MNKSIFEGEGSVKNSGKASAFIFGLFVFLGLVALGYILGRAAIEFKEYERTVVVKGLSERIVEADIVVWPIRFTEADNDLENLYKSVELSSSKIRAYLRKRGILPQEISSAPPSITDKSAQQYSNSAPAVFRYTAMQTLTVYSKDVKGVRRVMQELSELGRQGIVFTGGGYQSDTEYIFSRLNDVKPEMIEEATRKARQVAEKFASDSNSRLGKIKRASQGRFSINPRDKYNPQIKKVRVVSTVEYYLSD